MKEKINFMKSIPHHLGIILDGNRRWAKEKRLPVFEGHRRGADITKKIIELCKKKGIKVLTLFVFSSENWKRDKVEINYLMKLLNIALSENYVKKVKKDGIRMKIIGQREKLPLETQKRIKKIEDSTKGEKEMVVNFALSYGGRGEITEAIKEIIRKKIPVEKITEDVISSNLWTSDLDLLIRTGKEKRISNFLIWQSAYSELYFLDKYWPEFSEKDLDMALEDYSHRQRRFGK